MVNFNIILGETRIPTTSSSSSINVCPTYGFDGGRAVLILISINGADTDATGSWLFLISGSYNTSNIKVTKIASLINDSTKVLDSYVTVSASGSNIVINNSHNCPLRYKMIST